MESQTVSKKQYLAMQELAINSLDAVRIVLAAIVEPNSERICHREKDARIRSAIACIRHQKKEISNKFTPYDDDF
jgi:hypothetical protein